jgi:hypothetical protein
MVSVHVELTIAGCSGEDELDLGLVTEVTLLGRRVELLLLSIAHAVLPVWATNEVGCFPVVREYAQREG